MHKIQVGGRDLPGPAEEAYSAPQTSSWIYERGLGVKREKERNGWKRRGKERERGNRDRFSKAYFGSMPLNVTRYFSDFFG